MMWSVTPLVADKKGKYCGFSNDEQSLMVAMEDGRFFNIAFAELEEMLG